MSSSLEGEKVMKLKNHENFKKNKCFTDTPWFQVGVHSRHLDE